MVRWSGGRRDGRDCLISFDLALVSQNFLCGLTTL